MKEVSKQNFGLVIAYLLPGLVALCGVSFFSDTVRLWLTTSEKESPTVAGFLYVTLAAFTAGLTLGALRSVSVDALHHHTGVTKPEWDFSEFQAKFWAFNQLVESHFCLYQFYAHMCLAIPLLVGCRMVAQGEWMDWRALTACLFLEAVLFVVSRATLKTYYGRVSHLLGTEKRISPADNRVHDAPERERTNQIEGVSVQAAAAEASRQVSSRRKMGRVPRW